MNTINLSWVRKQKEFHRAALADLEATERVLLGQAPAPKLQSGAVALAETARSPANPPPGVGGGIPRYFPKSRPEMDGETNRQRIFRLLAASPSGLATRQIIEALISEGQAHRTTRNTSPQLSGWGKDGWIRLRDGVWHLTDKGRGWLSEINAELQMLRGQP
jgi:hypothetical protein